MTTKPRFWAFLSAYERRFENMHGNVKKLGFFIKPRGILLFMDKSLYRRQPAKHQRRTQAIALSAAVVCAAGCSNYPTAYTAGSQQINANNPSQYHQDFALSGDLVNTSTTDISYSGSVISGDQVLDVDSHFDNIHQRSAGDQPFDQEAYLLRRSVESTTAKNSDLWASIATKMTLLNTIQHDAVDKQIAFYSKRPTHLNRIADRSQRYLYHIATEIERRKLPMELAMLPAIESAYDPFAYSSGRASGLWQFVPNTAKHVGLKTSWWYDGRRDILASTDSALDYLTDLHRRFDGDWLLALAAYNSGAGTVHRAMRKNRKAGKPVDYWSLDLPQETKLYVPRLLAISKLIKRAKSFDIQLPTLPNAPYFEVVQTHGQLDLAHAAELAGVSIDEIYRLNPGFNRWATDPVGPHRLLVPTNKSAVFEEALANIPKNERMAWQQYKVQSGDSLILLAKRFGTDVATIKAANKLDNNMIRSGVKILVPSKSISRKSYATNSENPLAAVAHNISHKQGHRLYHVVKKGESLWSIATKYDVRGKDIADWNSMKKKDFIRPGQTLTVWKKPPTRSAEKNAGIIRKVGYTVRNGDSLSRIASRFKVNVADIGKWNGQADNKYIKPGQHLTLYVDVTK